MPAFTPRRSARISSILPFRFTDLPPEIRNIIYTYALTETGRPRSLLSGMSDTALALNHVSPAVRTESNGVYFAENSFEVTVPRFRWHQHALELQMLQKWAKTWGKVAAPLIRSLVIRLFVVDCFGCGMPKKKFILTLKDATLSSSPDTWCGLCNKLSPGDAEDEANFRAMASSVLRKQVDPKLEAHRILFLLTGLRCHQNGYAHLSEKRKRYSLQLLQQQLILEHEPVLADWEAE